MTMTVQAPLPGLPATNGTRRLWLTPFRRRHSPTIPTWSSMIALELVAPAHNHYRSYRLQIAKDLFGHWVLIRSWGRIGKTQRIQVQVFASQFEAKDVARHLLRRRLLHGYAVTALA